MMMMKTKKKKMMMTMITINHNYNDDVVVASIRSYHLWWLSHDIGPSMVFDMNQGPKHGPIANSEIVNPQFNTSSTSACRK